MIKTWSQIETRAILDKLEGHYPEGSIRMYQKRNHPELLIINLSYICSDEIKALTRMGTVVTIFPDGMRLELRVRKMENC